MYIMAEDGNFPKYFGKVHPKYKSPYRAVVLCGVLGVFFILSGSIKIVAMMCSYNQIQATSSVSRPSWDCVRRNRISRDHGMPCGYFRSLVQHRMFATAADTGIRSSCYLVQHHLGRMAILYFVIFVRKRPIPQEAVDAEALALATADPNAEEKAKLDKQYKDGESALTACCWQHSAVRNHLGRLGQIVQRSRRRDGFFK